MMLAVLHLLAMFVVDLFKSRHRLEVENLFLRHQLNIAFIAARPVQTADKPQFDRIVAHNECEGFVWYQKRFDGHRSDKYQ